LNVSQFSSQFQFQLTNALADGFTFTIQGAGPTAVGAGGGGLGYGYSPGISTTGGIPTSVAIKFDIYDNVGEGTDSTGMYLNGAGPGTPAVDLSNTGIVLRSGDIINAALNYDGTTLAVTLTDTVTGKTATQNYTVNIPKTVNGTTAFVGFTAGTGGSTAIEDILTWTFSPTSSSAQPAVPSSFTAVATSGTQTNLNWTENPAGASGFLIERATGSGAFSQVGTSATTSFMDTGLTTGQTYSYRVRAQNGSLLSGYSSVQTLVMPTIPAAPTNAHVTFVGSTEIDIAWTNNANNASGYRIYSQTTKSGPFNLLVTVPASASTYQNTGIPSGTLNNYDVEAFNIAGFSAPTTTAAVTIAAPPTALGVAAGSGQNTLSWTGSTGADTYNVYRGTSPGAEGNTPYKTGITATSFVDSSLATGVTYYYQVTAVDSGGESTSSNEAGATLQSQSGLRAGWTSADIGSPALAGSATSAGDGFTVQGGGSDIWGASDQFQFAYKPLSVDFTITAHVAGIVSTSPWTKAGVMIRESLAPNSNHAFMLLSSDNGVRLIYRDPAAPNSVDINPNTGSVSSYWVRLVRTGGSVTGFESADGVTWVQVGGPVPIATGTVYVGLAVTSHNAGALTTGTFDHVLITGSTVAPPPPTAPADPSNLQAGGTPGGTITLTWSDNSTNETGFAVDRATDANFTQNLKTSTVTSANPALTGTTTFTDTTTSAGVTYFYRVRAVNGSLASNNTATATAVGQTTNPSPTAPLPLTSLDIGGPAFPGSVNFNANSGVYTVTGGGSDIWWGKDQFQFDYMALPANGTIIAHVSGIGAANEWAKAGVMIRQSLSSSSNFAMMLLSESHGVHLQSRTAAFPNGFDADPKSGNQTSYWVKLIRSGGSVTGFESSDGINWVQVGAAVPMAGGTIFIGLAVTAHNNFTSTTASFDHVSITTP
jgi:fibronectin type 3 domain-containing protein